MKNHLKKYWGWYTLLAAAVVGALVYFNWETVKGWFTTDGAGDRIGSTVSLPIRDNNGRLTGGFYTVIDSPTQRSNCQKVTTTVGGVTYTGWVGSDCKFPISTL